jgi:hypothetical protein
MKHASHSGRQCFEQFFSTANIYIEDTKSKLPSGNEMATFQAGYKRFFETKEFEIGHYFRNLYTIIKHVDKSDIQDRRQYTNIVRAQLSKFEIGLLSYNCLSKEGEKKFKSLVERYSLLKQAHLSDIPQIVKEKYREIAFGFENMPLQELKNFPKDHPEEYEKIKPRIDEEIKNRENIITPSPHSS